MIKEILTRTARQAVNLTMVRCIVKEVYQQSQTCDVEPLNGDAEILGVKLKAREDSEPDGIVVYPAIGSDVVVGFTDGNDTDAFVLVFSDFDQVLIDGGQNEGLVKLPVLRDEIQKLNNFLLAIKNTFSTWAPVASDGGAALKAAMNAALANVQTADLSNAGNGKFKH
jgi:hypothetical protein